MLALKPLTSDGRIVLRAKEMLLGCRQQRDVDTAESKVWGQPHLFVQI